MRNCDKKRLALWAAGTLAAEEQRACEAHLANCAECQRAHREMTALVSNFSSHAASLPAVEGVRELHQSLERQLDGQEERDKIPPTIFSILKWFFRLAAPLVVVAGFVIWSNVQRRGQIAVAPRIVQSLPSVPLKANVLSAPTFSSYSSATRRSLEEFDRVLDAQIRASATVRMDKTDAPISLRALL